MKALLVAAALPFIALPAAADIQKVASNGSVTATMDALEAAVTGAGAAVVARVDHGKGAASVNMELGEAQLLIFGNPKIGTPAMQADPLAGLFLPLKVLVYADAEGKVWLAYEEPEESFDDLDDIPDAVTEPMSAALKKLTAAAAQ